MYSSHAWHLWYKLPEWTFNSPTSRNTLISSFTYKDTDAQKSFSTCSSLVQGSIPDSNWWTNSVKCFVWQQVSAHLGLLSVSSAHRCNACLLGLSTVTHRSHMLYSLKHSRRIYPELLFLLHNFSCRFGLSLAHTSFSFLCKLRTFPFHLKKTLYTFALAFMSCKHYYSCAPTTLGNQIRLSWMQELWQWNSQ